MTSKTKKKNTKFLVPVYIVTEASLLIGEVEMESNDPKEYERKAMELWESQGHDHPTLNIHNDFDLGDWDILPQNSSDIEFFREDHERKNAEKKK